MAKSHGALPDPLSHAHDTRANAEALTPALPIVKARHRGRWALAVISVLILAWFGHSVATNPGYGWPVVWKYLTFQTILTGFLWTLGLTAASMAIGMILGVIAALMRQSSNPIVSAFAALYIWIFRGTPLLVQLIFWYNLAALYPQIDLGLPFFAPIASLQTNSIVTPIVAALLGLGLNEGAYMAEIVRSGLLSVDPGQREAAYSLGLSPARTIRRIILPQALRVIVPPTGNEIVGMLKATSLVSTLAIGDLLYSAQGIYSRTFETIPLLIVASLWYLLASTLLTALQMTLERKLRRVHSAPPTDGLSRVVATLKPQFLLRRGDSARSARSA
ncbi:amino acid ABC transporter permease [Paraburkholderia xenovorans]|uniref:amino acid ABC transporter permease n=1 Tax=Paraburkholderia xenovorans TaxID=36873 RepID=UPI00155A015C|nr:amino acid ABC transporter permease [Paraburkholderia xenovorans]NPT33651.1 ABC transporter permease subunit [Paraburkholderia xenovorans]